MGVVIEVRLMAGSDSRVGLNGLQAPANPLYLGNSGTSTRLLQWPDGWAKI